MPGFLKCDCEHCGGRIEYPAEAVGVNATCPHCQQETPLKLDSGDDAETVTVGGGKAKLVIGVVVASLVAVGALAGALVWVKHKAAQKEPSAAVSPAAGKAEKPEKSGAAVVTANSSARVQLDPPKEVTPVIFKFQSGLTGAQIKHGRELFGGACTECHRQYDPATYNETEWERTIGGMRGKAKLKGGESAALDTFVRTVRN
ncbi:MAG: hypothetical protein EBS05_08985 [Proteobacteria bacterium]|nr:hypothetical protein [Pseudomonadota bacterium]